MGLLDSNKVGQLTKTATLVVEKSASDYISDTINLSGYNSITFKVTVNSGSLDGTTNYLSFNAQTAGSSNLWSTKVYKRNYTKSTGFEDAKGTFTNGFYVTEDLSQYTSGAFYLHTSSLVNITVEYTLSNNTFQDVINGWKLDDIKTNVTLIKEDTIIQRDLLLKTFENVDMSEVGANIFYNFSNINTKYNALKINVVFNQEDSNAALVVMTTKGSNSSASGFKTNVVIREDGCYTMAIKANEGVRWDFYLEEIPSCINMRKDVAGTSGTTATIKIYACTLESVPKVNHIQSIFRKVLTNADSGQDIVISNLSVLKMFKFFFCVVGAANNSKTGTVTKNYVTNDEDDSETILSFTNKTIAVSKWLPVTLTTDMKITFNVTGARNNVDKIEIYGVV